MPYIGNQSTNSYSSMVKQDLTGASGASITLSHPVANANEVELYINNVRQEPTTSYTTNGTTLNFVGYTVAASDDIYVIFSGKALQTVVPPDGSVSTAKIADSAVSTAKIADSAVSTAKIASSAVNLTSKVTGVLPVANGGTGSSSFTASTMTLETAQTANGNDEIDYGSIPSGTKRITVMFHLLSNGGSGQLQVQLGTSSGLTTSGYVSRSDWGSGGEQTLTGFGVYGISGSSTLSGIMTLVHMGSNVWVESHTARYNSSNGVFGGGGVTLGGTCDRIRITPNASNTFDGGSVNVMYES